MAVWLIETIALVSIVDVSIVSMLRVAVFDEDEIISVVNNVLPFCTVVVCESTSIGTVCVVVSCG